MEKSEILQQWIEGAIPDPFLFQQRRAVYTHLLGTAHFAAMLAMKRGADSEAAELAGLLHDISTYLTGEHEDHARKGAALTLRILGDLQLGTPQQQEEIALAVQRHSDKEHIQTPLDEVLKDADVLDHVFNYKNADPAGNPPPACAGAGAGSDLSVLGSVAGKVRKRIKTVRLAAGFFCPLPALISPFLAYLFIFRHFISSLLPKLFCRPTERAREKIAFF